MASDTPEDESKPPSDPQPEIKWTNRRRMAWVSLISGLILGVIMIIGSMAVPEIADRMDKMSGVILGLLTFLGTPVIVYMGGTAALNWKQGK